MAFTVPTFNLISNIWRFGNGPPNPPDVVSICNLARGERESTTSVRIGTNASYRGGMWLLLPRATDIRDSKAPAGGDMVEVPANSGRFYGVTWVDDAGAGFSNEHRFAALACKDPWPLPFPAPSQSYPPGNPVVANFQAQINLGPAGTGIPVGGTPGTLMLLVGGCAGPPGTVITGSNFYNTPMTCGIVRRFAPFLGVEFCIFRGYWLMSNPLDVCNIYSSINVGAFSFIWATQCTQFATEGTAQGVGAAGAAVTAGPAVTTFSNAFGVVIEEQPLVAFPPVVFPAPFVAWPGNVGFGDPTATVVYRFSPANGPWNVAGPVTCNFNTLDATANQWGAYVADFNN